MRLTVRGRRGAPFRGPPRLMPMSRPRPCRPAGSVYHSLRT
jgi:hypothetical protein